MRLDCRSKFLNIYVWTICCYYEFARERKFLRYSKNPYQITCLVGVQPDVVLSIGHSSNLRPKSGMQSRNMVGQLYLLLYFFYQAELFPDDKTRRPALP